jgi:hypothetical protein
MPFEAASLLSNFGLAPAACEGGIWTHVRGESTPRLRAKSSPTHARDNRAVTAAPTAPASSSPAKTPSPSGGVRETRVGAHRPATTVAGQNFDKEVGP